MSRETLKYLKIKYHKGKTLVASILDTILSHLILFIVVFLFSWYSFFKLSIALTLALCATAIVGIVVYYLRRRRFEKFAAAEYINLKNKYMLERLLVLNEKDLNTAMLNLFKLYTKSDRFIHKYGGYYDAEEKVFCYMLDNHPTNEVSAQQMLSLFRKLWTIKINRCILLTASTYSVEARAFCSKVNIPCELLCGDTLICLAADLDMIPSEEAILSAIEREIEQHALDLKKIRNTILSRSKSKAYLLCALTLTVWPIFTKFNILYPLLACACIVLSFISYRRSGRTETTQNL